MYLHDMIEVKKTISQYKGGVCQYGLGHISRGLWCAVCGDAIAGMHGGYWWFVSTYLWGQGVCRVA